MVTQVSLFKLRPEITPDKLEEIMRKTRSQLLQIREVLTVRAGKRIDPLCEWPFVIILDFDSRDKQAMCHDDPIWVKFTHEVIEPFTSEQVILDYELDPGKNVKYS
ncbi:MAG: Dabb family protein [Verrucomicrobiales bacterium]